MGRVPTSPSFNYSPLWLEELYPEADSPFLTDPPSSLIPNLPVLKDTSNFQSSLLPIDYRSRVNTGHPYGWGDGMMLPARGLQTMVSAGVHIKKGNWSFQFYPQMFYAQNLSFPEYPEDAPNPFFQRMNRGVNGVDAPVRHGDTPHFRMGWGQSHIRYNFGSFSAGLSTENMWWGPGQFNALLMSDNAQGFPHLTLQTRKPAKTFMGDFEGQYFVGRLGGSGFTHFSDNAHSNIFEPKNHDLWRYFTGISVSYSPSFLEGFSLGISRTFQVYREDMRSNVRAYFPLFAPLPKEGEGNIENIELREDQNLAGFARWVIPAAKFEFYMEYLRNDHALNWRDVVLNPEHSRAYTLGFSKYLPMPDKNWLGIRGEMTQTQISINNNVRWRGRPNFGLGLYDNNQVRHGLTNRGQILGSGLGISGNLAIMEFSLVKEYRKYELSLERLARDQNFFRLAQSDGVAVLPWVDLGIGVGASERYGRYLLEARAKFIRSFNYHFYNPDLELGNPVPPSLRQSNLHLDFRMAYIL